MSLRPAVQRYLLLCAMALSAQPALSAGLFTQLVVPFPSERPFTYAYNKGEHALVLAFQKTSPNELGALDQYDERLIRRVLIKDLGPAGTEVKLILRDRDVRAVVHQFAEPFRITVDLFDADYEEDRDPQTGMPLLGNPQSSAAGKPGMTLLAPDNGGNVVGGGDAPGATVVLGGGGVPVGADGASAPDFGGKKHLLEPVPELFSSPDEFAGTMRGTADGVGKAWKDYPPFIYRLQTAAYAAGLGGERQGAPSAPTSVKALSSAEAMAEYAGKLFDMGHEAKALVAYQQVLHKDPTVFDRDALHLWKFAETHLGQGNLTLAHGYYEALTEKHPESPLANMARLRLADVEAIRMLQEGRYVEWPTLLPKLEQIKLRNNGELAALVGIRRAYFDKADLGKVFAPERLPALPVAARNELAGAFNQVESSHTAFLGGSLLLNALLAPAVPWQRSTGAFADGYFKRFSGPSTEPYRGALHDALEAKLNQDLQQKVADGKLLEAVDDYEALPSSLRNVKKTPKTAWALAEAYRKLGQNEKAAVHYAAATKTEQDGPDRFKAEFWLSVTAGELAEGLRKDGAADDKVAHFASAARAADKDADATWQRLKEEERAELAVAYKDPFEKTVTSPAKLKAGPKIVLASWTTSLSSRADAQSGGDKGDWNRAFSPSGSAVILLTDLARRFSELGMPTERRASLDLLKHLKPADFKGDKAANKVWADQLVGLAEDYRRSSQYLDAGRLYDLVGAESENWEGRAEALYKGGLLLYRAGRRAEAVDAFKKASEDGNNLFYANLAKERLSQLQ